MTSLSHPGWWVGAGGSIGLGRSRVERSIAESLAQPPVGITRRNQAWHFRLVARSAAQSKPQF